MGRQFGTIPLLQAHNPRPRPSSSGSEDADSQENTTKETNKAIEAAIKHEGKSIVLPYVHNENAFITQLSETLRGMTIYNDILNKRFRPPVAASTRIPRRNKRKRIVMSSSEDGSTARASGRRASNSSKASSNEDNETTLFPDSDDEDDENYTTGDDDDSGSERNDSSGSSSAPNIKRRRVDVSIPKRSKSPPSPLELRNEVPPQTPTMHNHHKILPSMSDLLQTPEFGQTSASQFHLPDPPTSDPSSRTYHSGSNYSRSPVTPKLPSITSLGLITAAESFPPATHGLASSPVSMSHSLSSTSQPPSQPMLISESFHNAILATHNHSLTNTPNDPEHPADAASITYHLPPPTTPRQCSSFPLSSPLMPASRDPTISYQTPIKTSTPYLHRPHVSYSLFHDDGNSNLAKPVGALPSTCEAEESEADSDMPKIKKEEDYEDSYHQNILQEFNDLDDEAVPYRIDKINKPRSDIHRHDAKRLDKGKGISRGVDSDYDMDTKPKIKRESFQEAVTQLPHGKSSPASSAAASEMSFSSDSDPIFEPSYYKERLEDEYRKYFMNVTKVSPLAQPLKTFLTPS